MSNEKKLRKYNRDPTNLLVYNYNFNIFKKKNVYQTTAQPAQQQYKVTVTDNFYQIS